MKKLLLKLFFVVFAFATLGQPAFGMKEKRSRNTSDQFSFVGSSFVSAIKRILARHHEDLNYEVPSHLLTKITFVSKTGTHFDFLAHEMGTLMQLSRTIAALLPDLQGTDVSTIPLECVSDDAFYLLTRMASGADQNSLLEYIRNLSARENERLRQEARFLDSPALIGLISRVLDNHFALLPDELLLLIFVQVGPQGRSNCKIVDRRFKHFVDVTRLSILKNGFGCTDTLPVVATIPVGRGANRPVVRGQMLHVANFWESTVCVIDTKTNQVSSISVYEDSYDNRNQISYVTNEGDGNLDLSIVHGQRLYVVSDKDDDKYDDNAGILYVIETSMNKVVAMIQVGCVPRKPAIHGQMLYVANHGDGTVCVIDTITNEVVATIQVGIGPLTPVIQGQMLYVLNLGSGTVSVIDIGGYLPGQL